MMTTEEWNDKTTGSDDGRADLSLPLGAVAMREACKDKLTSGTTLLRNCGMRDIADLLTDHAADFDTLPLPDHAALLAHAMRLPEVVAMVQAATELVRYVDDLSSDAWCACNALETVDLRTALSALEAKP